jgi:predicted Zn-dependent protease
MAGLCLPIIAGCFVAGCTTVEGTGRRQLMLIPESQDGKLGAEAYQQVLAEERESTDAEMTAVLRRVGERIAAVANRPDFEWEFRLIESEQVNAFCLPGGKIAVYTGILPIMKNEAGMAVVIGHEVAHAVARHGPERMSQQMSVGVIQEILKYGLKDQSPTVQSGALQAFGVGATVGAILPFSREHELEADHLGLMYAARAGYDPNEAVPLWERMGSASQGRPPEFLSTHPHVENRITQLRDLMPKAMEEYKAAPQQHGAGEPLR